MKKITVALSVLLGFSPFTASAAEGVVIVYDGSNSMWGQIDGVAKIETAREVMADLVETWPQSTNLGLLAYGHRRKGDCSDIELMIPPGPVDRASFLETVNAITPRGKTPLTDAVVQAAKNLSFRDNPATVVLISDGIESCQADPCSISAQLEEQGIAFTTHVIGFDIAREDQRQLSCIAENTGGTFVPAQDANELRGAIAQVQQVIEAQPESVPSVEPEPEPKQEVSVSAPKTVVAGTLFDVSWSEALNPRDLVLIALVGSEADAKSSYLPVRDDTEGKLTAPSEPGLYEVRYRLDEGRVILASAPVEVTVAEVALTAPALVRAETEIQVSWQPSVNPRDLVLIAPAGSPADEKLSYAPARTENKTTLKAPSEPGLYEVRYRLDEGRRVIAAVPLEVVPADAPLDDGAGLNAPESAAPSETITVSWTIAPEDADRRVALAKADAPDFTWISAHPVGAETETEIILPNEPGLYEVRFLDLSIQSVLGRTIVAVGE
ncbi:VWA domain-containing protein [Sulfitobacter sp. DFL-23]|uniref:VWA domain-containing protein n=1 Tax=Sulfitobacter sp. DFL-23 TaxID=215829 RepID=UPI0013B37D9C|nr:VWA domain-containing protein [Sulfitobacter sp. DFL-23]